MNEKYLRTTSTSRHPPHRHLSNLTSNNKKGGATATVQSSYNNKIKMYFWAKPYVCFLITSILYHVTDL